MQHYTNYSLKKRNTFGLDAKSKDFYVFENAEELSAWLGQNQPGNQILVIGGGSNLLFTKDFEGAILSPEMGGIEIIKEDENEVLVRFAAGEEWDVCVQWAVENGLGGIENLSYIPGNVGAAPVQNIGAYGVEVADVVEYVEGLMLEDGSFFQKSRSECDFDYRYSIFKGPLKGKVVVTGVVLRLSRKPEFSMDYGAVRERVHLMGGPSLANIRKAIVDIRKEKLPEPEEFGNAGSFFKNPVVEASFYQQLQQKWPEIPGYVLENGKKVKVPAGWLIEKTGWKGREFGNAGVHKNQALVLINRGLATGSEIAGLAKAIQEDVYSRFGVQLHPEVNIL
ncbi:UDP-N-acetylmuramate dehydrogenase [Marinilabilia salmonicolor]|uniref:UDP-N-acetylmuramate dehydrogenase n=1 Tax=Marinilabilia salmonicolor TaxID=989 RepID=UPI000D05D39B|nr:UDP-N-acetylmuramate dehydrogenase [Marinilabilia salmonicolor]PRY89520.1 UDP-N-acetylmuramate dehydrogenase [Marinilabilia salmonicolor]